MKNVPVMKTGNNTMKCFEWEEETHKKVGLEKLGFCNLQSNQFTSLLVVFQQCGSTPSCFPMEIENIYVF